MIARSVRHAVVDYVTDQFRHFSKEQETTADVEATLAPDAKLPSDFGKLAVQYPDLTAVWKGLETWFAQNPGTVFLYEDRLMRELPEVDPVALAVALQILVRDGSLTRKYRLRTPSGKILDEEEYDDLESIEPEVFDTFDEVTLQTDELEPVTGYRVEAG